MTNNPMDTLTAKELEEQMGFSESQKSALLAAGLTKLEVKELHNRRVAEAIAKERERLSRLETKVKKSLPNFLAAFLEGADDVEDSKEDTDRSPEEAERDYQNHKFLLPPEDEDVELPWEGRNDLLFTNKDYWAECYKLTKNDKSLALPDNLEDMSYDEFEQWRQKWEMDFNKKTDEVFERRRMGYMKAEYDWIKGHCKGKPPEPVADIM